MGHDAIRSAWATRVGLVFTTNPRIRGDAEDSMWFPRPPEERQFADALQLPGLHICLDGPTGTGKSSLAMSQLVRWKVPFVLVHITHTMTWAGFCEEIILPRTRYAETNRTTEITVGFDGGHPTALLKVIWGEGSETSRTAKAAKELANTWTEHDVARCLSEANVALLVDDMETATEEVLTRLVGLCRILTQTYTAPFAKCVIVGTGDVFRRLYQRNVSLEERLREISLGTLPGPGDSWVFLRQGFEVLGLYHPGNSKIPAERRQVKDCIAAISEGANGLPKSLNRLGQDIAQRARAVGQGAVRPAVSAADIRAEALSMPERNWDRYSRDFPKLVDVIVRDETTIDLIRLLYRNGIGRIHNIGTIHSELSHFTEDQISNSIDDLVKAQFLTKTGISGNVLYVAQPTLAHTLGVLLSKPASYPRARRLHERSGQLMLSLPLVQPSDDQL